MLIRPCTFPSRTGGDPVQGSVRPFHVPPPLTPSPPPSCRGAPAAHRRPKQREGGRGKREREREKVRGPSLDCFLPSSPPPLSRLPRGCPILHVGGSAYSARWARVRRPDQVRPSPPSPPPPPPLGLTQPRMETPPLSPPLPGAPGSSACSGAPGSSACRRRVSEPPWYHIGSCCV